MKDEYESIDYELEKIEKLLKGHENDIATILKLVGDIRQALEADDPKKAIDLSNELRYGDFIGLKDYNHLRDQVDYLIQFWFSDRY